MTHGHQSTESCCSMIEWALIVTMAVYLAFSTYSIVQLDNDMSRFATAERLVEARTWIIDESPFHLKRNGSPIVDKVKKDGHFYSTKPPVMSFLMAAEYAFWRNIFGLRFDNPDHKPFLVWVLTFTFVGVPFLIGAVVFRRAAGWFIEDPAIRVVGLFVLLFGTQLWGFSRTLQNHVPAAVLLLAVFVESMGMVHGKVPITAWRFLLVGFLAALLPTVDLPGAFFCIFLFAYLVWNFPRQTMTWFMLGAVPPLALHFALTYSVTGGIKPIYLDKSLYFYKGSYWSRMQGMDALEEPKSVQFFHLSVGRKGLFSLYPFVLLAFAGRLAHLRKWGSALPLILCGVFAGLLLVCAHRSHVYAAASGGTSPEWVFMAFPIVLSLALIALVFLGKEGGNSHVLWLEFLAMAGLTVVWLLFYNFKTNNYGGLSFGYRWFMFFTPALVFFSTLYADQIKNNAGRTLVLFLVAFSVYTGWLSSLDPWTVHVEWPVRFLGEWTFK